MHASQDDFWVIIQSSDQLLEGGFNLCSASVCILNAQGVDERIIKVHY